LPTTPQGPQQRSTHALPIADKTTRSLQEITWSGGELPDDFYDEFVFVGRLTGFAPGTVLSFPTVQECAGGVHRWIEIPAAGQDPDELDEPAPQLTIVEGADGG
jgi:uncharacterized protein YcnI